MSMADISNSEVMLPSAQLLGIKFDFMNEKEIEKVCNIKIVEPSDVTNAKLGLPNQSTECTTCGATNLKECEGHFGSLKFPMHIYNPYILPEVVHLLNQICPGCKAVKKESREEKVQKNKLLFALQAKLRNIKFAKFKLSDEAQSFLAQATSGYKRKREGVKNQASCKYCARNPGQWYPQIKYKISSSELRGKKGFLITAEINERLPKKFRNRTLSQVLPKDFWNFIVPYPNLEVTDLSRITISPSQAFILLKEVKRDIIEQFVPRRDMIFLSCLPVTPNCQRVVERSHMNANVPQLSFDGCTKAYRRLADSKRKLEEFRKHDKFSALSTLYVANRLNDCLSLSKLHSNIITSIEEQSSRELKKKIDHPSCTGLSWVKEVVLSKRTDNTFRMVMIGDPKIHIGEIGIPQNISETLQIDERVNSYNLEKLKLRCKMLFLSKEELHVNVNGKLTLIRRPDQLQIGHILRRPIENGDLILVNRNPSVHQHSLLALSVKVLPIQAAISINPLCCAPLLGDFDGDCIHGYIPQSVHAKVELRGILGLDHQLLNGQDGRSLFSLTHDSLAAAYLLTREDALLNKFEMQQLEMLCPFQSQCPAIIKAPLLKRSQWTGAQLFSMFLPPNMDLLQPTEIEISKGEIVTSPGVSWLQNRTSGIFSLLFRSYGDKALNYLSSAQDVLCEYLTMRGLSVSLSDIYLTSDTYMRVQMMNEVNCALQQVKESCYVNELIIDPDVGFLLKDYDEAEDLACKLNLPNFAWGRRPINQASIIKYKDLFRELQNVIYHYISKDNSLLSMVSSGSKGSLTKLVQQSVCLGLQLSSISFPFKIPRKLSCSEWNKLKASIQDKDDIEDDYCGGLSSCSIIESSFLNGLNPLECLLHVTSGRGNLFSENAELPGTLTRKLMFYMRDLNVAYDGTVRSPYGKKIVQFSYNSTVELDSENRERSGVPEGEHSEFNGVGGEPVGSKAACAVSEAAYGGLDQPMSSLESSPLLKLKKVLQCAPAKTSLDRTGTLILSNKLRKLHYGFEYGALAVKEHLEKVFFSDIVTSVMIFYTPHDVEGVKGIRPSPWISHFHINKERLKRKRLNIQSILDFLTNNYACVREKFAVLLPRLCITSKNCVLCEKEGDEFDCISVVAENSSKLSLLDTIKDSVIPVLMGTLIKGFIEFKKVEILCDSQPKARDLYLKITMSEICSPKKFWQNLQTACIPIMDLIDWHRSHPDGVHDISSSFGISCAWEYFAHSLHSAISDVGRSINLEHVLLVADSLSVTGEFYGLTPKGLKQQRDQLSISSPFTQAFFANPENNFIEAAKQRLEDKLLGTVDAVAWGKDAPVGTGGPFEVIYSGEACNQNETKNPYEMLFRLKQDTPDYEMKKTTDNWKRSKFVSSTYGNMRKRNDYSYTSLKEEKTTGFNSKSIPVHVGQWADIKSMASSLKEIFHKYPINAHLNATDKSSLLEALKYHPNKDAKIGVGIEEIKIGYHPSRPLSRSFILVRKDGTSEDFSYRKCVEEAAKQISSSS